MKEGPRSRIDVFRGQREIRDQSPIGATLFRRNELQHTCSLFIIAFVMIYLEVVRASERLEDKSVTAVPAGESITS